MIDFYSCNEYQTQLLLQFLLEKCDCFTFCLPNYGTIFNISDSSNILKDYTLIKDKLERNNEEFLIYKNNVSDFFEEIKEDIITNYRSNHYYGELCNYEKEIYLVKYNHRTMNVLRKYGCFSNWLSPKFPEDLFFWDGDVCYFSSISHEEEYSIYDDSEPVRQLLSEIGLEYYISENIEIPSLYNYKCQSGDGTGK